MVKLAMRALVFVGLAGVARDSNGGCDGLNDFCLGGLDESFVFLYSMMSCLCSASWHKWSTSLILMVDGNGLGFLGSTKEVESVKNDVYSESLRIMPMCLWSPSLFVVGMVASIAPSSWVSWFMSCRLVVHRYIGDAEFLKAVFDVLLDPHGGSKALLLW